MVSEDVAALGVAEALHHRGVADEVGEEDGHDLLAVIRRTRIAQELVHRAYDRLEVAVCKEMSLAIERHELGTWDAGGELLSAREGHRWILHPVQNKRWCADEIEPVGNVPIRSRSERIRGI